MFDSCFSPNFIQQNEQSVGTLVLILYNIVCSAYNNTPDGTNNSYKPRWVKRNLSLFFFSSPGGGDMIYYYYKNYYIMYGGVSSQTTEQYSDAIVHYAAGVLIFLYLFFILGKRDRNNVKFWKRWIPAFGNRID